MSSLLMNILIGNASVSFGTSPPAKIKVENTGNVSISYEKFDDVKECPNQIPPGKTVDIKLDDIARLCIRNGNAKVTGCPNKEGPVPLDTDTFTTDFCSARVTQDGDEFYPGGWDDSIPYVISPRYTKVLNSKVILRWHHINDSAKYEVKLCRIYIIGEDCFWKKDDQIGLVLRQEDRTIEVSYLQTDLAVGDYTLYVKSGSLDSNMEKEPLDYSSRMGVSGRLFKVVSEKEAKQVKSKTSILRSSESSDPGGVEVDVARFYSDNDFYADAIQELEGLLNKKGKDVSPSVYETLGDVYRKTGLNFLAAKNYKDGKRSEKLEKLCRRFPDKNLPGCKIPKLPGRAN